MSEDRNPSEASSTKLNGNALDKNKLYIIIASVVILIAVIVFFFFANGKTKTSNNNSAANNNAATQAQLKIVNEEGDFNATIKAEFEPVRRIKFGTSLKKIQKMEKKHSDTDNGNYQEAQDNSGYGYLTYGFKSDAKETPTFFGGNINISDPSANLVYVLKDKKLIEVRVSYGASSAANYDAMVAANTKTYGKPNLTRSYSNGTKITYWRTKKVMLQLYSQIDQQNKFTVSAYLSKIN